MSSSHLVLLHAPSVYDFREKAILYGPISDLVPSSPVFEMYPIGFVTLAEYLARHGFRTRIVNLAVRMLRDPHFDAESAIRALTPLAFGIDLHWLPHAHGALEVARLVKKHHPRTPVILGGFSASYYHRELLARPEVDFVLRGDSTEEPLCQLMSHLHTGSPPLSEIPNLSWRDEQGRVHMNPLTYLPASLDHLRFDYSHLARAVVRDHDLLNYLPFARWIKYPIMPGLTARGCTLACVTCGGSALASRHLFNRARPAFRAPELVARDLQRFAKLRDGPVFVIGDIRQAGGDYARQFLAAMRGTLELFGPASHRFIQEVAEALPGFSLQLSLESHDPQVRRAFGKACSNEAMERTIAYALDAGCERLDVFFMIGLPRQTYDSAMGTVDYCRRLLERFQPDGRLHPFISPLAPFLDPASPAFEEPARHGYRLFCRTLEEHRRALLAPSWKYSLNYATEWMTRDEIVASTYQAGLGLNRLKAEFGLIRSEQAARTEKRIQSAVELMAEIDGLVAETSGPELERKLSALKREIDQVNTSTVCDKGELEWPAPWAWLNPLRIVRGVIQDAWEERGQRAESG